MYAYPTMTNATITARKTTMRPFPLVEFPPPLVQWISQANENADAAVTKAPANVKAPVCGAFGVCTNKFRDWPCRAWLRYDCVLRSCDATMIYLKCSKNLALSARPSLEFTAFWRDSVSKSSAAGLFKAYGACIVYRGDRIVLGYC
jgi:hypothetical protein